MKKFVTKLLLIVMIVPFLLVTNGCGKNAKITAMQVDLNPSVEFMLDESNKVVSVTALNDDGAIILYGEAFVGKSADEAVKLFVNVALDTGYLVSGSQENNELNISLSCDTKQAEKIYKDVKSKVEKFYTENDIDGKLASLKTLTLEDVKNKVYEAYPELKNVDLKKEEALEKLAETRKETQELISTNLRDLYYNAKEYKLELSKNEKIAKIIEDAGSTYATLLTQYNNLLDSFDETIKLINDKRQELLIDSDSAYQKALKTLIDQKAKLLEAKKELSVLEAKENKTALENLKITTLQTTITGYESALGIAEVTLNGLYQSADIAIDLTVNTLSTIKTSLENLKQSFPQEINTLLQNKTVEIENAVNTEKTNFFNAFETEYNTQIENYENYIKGIKENLKAE